MNGWNLRNETRARAPHLYESRGVSAKNRLLRSALAPVPGPSRLPTFLIVGEKRCGTTSLHRYLTQHPQVLGPLAPKSTHYFDTNFTESRGWYESYFWPDRLVRQIERRRGPVAIGESSPYYLFHPAAASRIAATLPEVRIIVLVREPGARAWSNYQYERDKGNETLSFTDAIAAEDERLAGEEQRLLVEAGYISHSHRTFSYVTRSRYHRSIRRLCESIDSSRVHVVRSEDLYRDTGPTMSRVHDFLELENVPVADQSPGRANDPEAPPTDVLERIRNDLSEDTEALYEFVGRRLWA